MLTGLPGFIDACCRPSLLATGTASAVLETLIIHADYIFPEGEMSPPCFTVSSFLPANCTYVLLIWLIQNVVLYLALQHFSLPNVDWSAKTKTKSVMKQVKWSKVKKVIG